MGQLSVKASFSEDLRHARASPCHDFTRVSQRAQRLIQERTLSAFTACGSRRAFIGPAGNVHCSVADLVRYGLAHLDGLRGVAGLQHAETGRELHRPGLVPYASGWGVDPASGQHRHRGSVGTFLAYLTIDPTAGVVVAFATNAGSDAQPASARAAEVIVQRAANR